MADVCAPSVTGCLIINKKQSDNLENKYTLVESKPVKTSN